MILIITLNAESENVQALQKSLRDQGLESKIFSAVDGRHETPRLEADESIDQELSFRQRLMTLSNSEIGCYLSHLRAIKEAYRTGANHICILEDDVNIEENFSSVLSAIIDLPEEFEFVRLMGLKIHKRKIIKNIGNVKIVRPVKGLCGTQGYVLNRSGMKKVIKQGSKLTKPIDKFYDHFWKINLNAFCVEPHIIWEIPSQSSVKKMFGENIKSTITQRLGYKTNKFMNSLSRNIYTILRFREFYPAKKIKKPQGKTARIH